MSKASRFSNLLAWAKPALIKFLKTKFIKTALKKILGSAAAGGIKGWIVKYVATELYDELAKPIINFTFRRIGYIHEVKNGQHVLTRIENAQDINEWSDAANDA